MMKNRNLRTNRKTLTSILLTLFIVCVFLLFSLSFWKAAEAATKKPLWLIQKEQGEDAETSDRDKDGVSTSGTVGVSSTTAKPTLPQMYFGDNRLLWKAGLLGDFQTTFLPLPPDLGYVAVDAAEQKIYFMEYFGKFIRRMDLDGRNVENVLSEYRLQELDIYRLGKPGETLIDMVDKKGYWLAWEEDPDTGLTTLSTISRINLDSTGEIQQVISVENRYIFQLTIDEENRKLYWLEDEGTGESLYGFITTIRSSNLDGSGVKNHVTGIETYINAFSIDNVGKKVYWIDFTSESGTDHYILRRANLDDPGGVVDVGTADGGEIVIDLGTGNTTSILVDEDNRILYWMGEMYFFDIDQYVYTVQRANIDDAVPTAEVVVRTQSDWLNHVTINHNLRKLYWTESDQLSTGEWIGSLWSISIDGTDDLENLTNIDSPGGIAVDTANESVYWTVPDLGIIRRANLDGTDMVYLLTGLNHPEDIVVDPVGGKFYWTQGPGPDENGNNIDVWSTRRANLDGTNWEVFDYWWKVPDVRGLAIDVMDRTLYLAIQ